MNHPATLRLRDAVVSNGGDDKQPGDDDPTPPGRQPGDADDGRDYARQ